MPRQADARGRHAARVASSLRPVLEIKLIHTDLLRQRTSLFINKLCVLIIIVLCVNILTSFVVAARVVGALALEHAHGHADDEREPHDGQGLQEEQHREEGPFDRVVIAHQPIGVPERLEQVKGSLVGGQSEGAGKVTLGTGEAAVRDDGGRVRVDRVADHQVQDVAGDEPGDHEDDEHEVAGGGVAEIFEALGELEVKKG